MSKQTMTDDGYQAKYFHMIYNMADDDLDPYEYRLFGHYKRVCGQSEGGYCNESTQTTAKICRMSAGKVSSTRRELEKKKYITIQEGTGDQPMVVRLKDLWQKNTERYSSKGSHSEMDTEQPVVHEVNAIIHTVNETIHYAKDTVQDMNASEHEVNESVHEVKQRITKEQKPTVPITTEEKQKDSAPQPGADSAPEPKTIPPPTDFSSSKQEYSGLMEQSVIAPRATRPLPVTPQEKPLTPQEAAAALREAQKQIGADVDPVKERQRDLLFDAVAQHVFRITSDEELKQLDAEEHAGTRIGIITSWLRQKCDRVKLAKGRAGTKVGYITHVADPKHVEAFGEWCGEKGFDPPKDLVKFVEQWRAFASEKKASKELDGKKYVTGAFADVVNH